MLLIHNWNILSQYKCDQELDKFKFKFVIEIIIMLLWCVMMELNPTLFSSHVVRVEDAKYHHSFYFKYYGLYVPY